MSKPTRFKVGDIIRTSGGKTPWRIESIGDGQNWLHRGRHVYRCISLLGGRHEEYRVSSTNLVPFTGPLPEQPPGHSRLSGHTLMGEGAPHDARGSRTSGYSWSAAGEGRAKCECGDLSPVLQSAGQRKQWHREHKDAIRAEQAA